MNLLQSIILGAVQGLTEFLPVSSTAHLIIIPKLLGWEDPGLTFDVALHLGTLVALLVYFRAEWIRLITSGVAYISGRSKDPLFFYIIVATIPGGLAGLLFEKRADRDLRDLRIVAAALVLLALVLVIAELKGRKRKDLSQISLSDAIVVGSAQALAIVPGVSRSGVTITAGLFRQMKREAAARFSFFLSTPLIAGAAVKKMLDVAKEGLPSSEVAPFITGIVVSAIVGYAAIKILLRYLQSHSTFVFVYYRIALGIALYIAFWAGMGK
jgi:undecaprenyl-diphosphatase